ncbi:MAG: elongation factor Ts [Spirochaetales bacterium]|nr:elongation factor Ts [Spirochaetales bacterium]
MEISAAEVKKLREKTGAGMMECKKALLKTDGDFAGAEKILKELGLAAAKKREGRVTKEGRIFSRVVKNRAALLELNCETDFVGKNKDFIAAGEKLINIVADKNPSEATDEMKEIVTGIVGIIKENITLKRFTTVDIADDERVADYIHGEGKYGVLVKIKLADPSKADNPEVREMLNDLALHATARAPLYLVKNDVDQNYLKEQEAIFTKQAESLGKPPNVVAGIVKGKLNKHLGEICFMDQPFVKDENLTVNKALTSLGDTLNSKIELTDFRYYKLGVDLDE